MHALRPQRPHRDRRGHRRVDSPRYAETSLAEAVLPEVVAEPERERAQDLGGSRELRRAGRSALRQRRARALAALAEVDALDRRRVGAVDFGFSAPGVVEPFLEHVLEREVDDEELLLEGRSAGQQLAVLVHDQRLAVEHELVLASDEIAVRDHDRVVLGARGDHPFAVVSLARVVGRGGQVDRQAGVALQRLRRQGLPRIPDVLADVDRERDVP